MALPTARPLWRSCGSPALGSLLLLLLSLGWVQCSKAWAGETGREAAPPDRVLANTPNIARWVWGPHSPGGRGSRGPGDCLSPAPSLHSPAAFSGSQACTRFFSRVSKANVDLLPRGAPERQRLLPAALACRGVQGSLVSEADVRALGGLACDLPGRFVAASAEAVLPRLVHCPGPLDWEQQEAARAALQGGGAPYGPPSTWSVSTLDALQGLLPVLGQPIVHSIPQGVVAAWQKHTSRDLAWRQPEQTILRPRLRRDVEKEACPPGKDVLEIDENLIFYKKWELEACVNASLLATQMDRVDAIPFTYEQLGILKHKLDEVAHDPGSCRPVVSRPSPVLETDAQCARKTSTGRAQLLSALLPQVATLIDRFMMGRRQLDKDTLDTLTAFYPGYLCSLSPEQLGSVPPSLIWAVRPQDVDTCGPRQLEVLYPKARLAFQNVNGSEYFSKIRSFLGGAPAEDLKVLSERNVSMDLATFMKLRTEAVLPLTVAEVQKLLGPHVEGLKAEERHSPLRDWILRQRQDDLDTLGLGLQGGIPNGYLVLDLGVREALSGTPCLLGPGPVLTLLALFLASTLA
ncbi:mesothelin [Cebus imitator]|uniref:mesothelin n=1 Tax=Cebus imitator TaxID=2715852 RepID=UPI00080A5FA7|nr:mesothelin [Cebus imitator]